MDQPSDIRNLSARRPASATVVELRSPAQLRPDLRDAIEPSAAASAARSMVIREHTNNAVRWKAGERLNHVLEEACIRFSENDAVVTDAGTLSYRDLDRRANQVARYLIEQGIQPGDRVGLLFDKSAETYVAMLAVMKVHAAYVPLDAAFPLERMRFILADAEITAIVSMSSFAERLAPLEVNKIFLDNAKRAIDKKDAEPAHRRAAQLRSDLLHHLHLGHDRKSEGRRHRARRASATSCASRPSFTAISRATASIRA